MKNESAKRIQGSSKGRKKLSDAFTKDAERLVRLKQTSKGKTVVFGSWKIKARTLPIEETIARVKSSNSALLRAKKTLSRSGVKLSRPKDVPLYRADPDHPDILIRELNGSSERVRLIDGEFKLVE
jgi:hypothetical protein